MNHLRPALSCWLLAAALGGCESVVGADFDDLHPIGEQGGGAGLAGAGGGAAGLGGAGQAGEAGTSGISGQSGASGQGGAGQGGEAGAAGAAAGQAGEAGEAGQAGVAGQAGQGGQGGGAAAGEGGGGQGGAAGVSGASGQGGAAGAAAGQGGAGGEGCPAALHGSPLVAIPAPGGGAMCIEATEVTRDQYAAFLAAAPGAGLESTERCAWNTSYQPDATCLARPDVCQTGCGSHPQVCVDWCDAAAYCAWAGKRLCGKIGGGPVAAYADLVNPSVSQWTNACMGGVAGAPFPYGAAYQAGLCNASGELTAPVASFPACHPYKSDYAGVLDLIGNVAEWEDGCILDTSPATDQCPARGGSFMSGDQGRCNDALSSRDRRSAQPNIGFRCCGP